MLFNWFPLTVDNVLAGFQKMITRLEYLIEHHENKAQVHADLVDRHATLQVQSEKEAQRAQAVIQKLKALVA